MFLLKRSAASCDDPFPVQGSNESQDFGNRFPEFDRNGFSHIARTEKLTCQPGVLVERDIVFLSDFFDSLGDSTATFGEDMRCLAFFEIISKGDGEVGRIGDDDLGLGNSSHHLLTDLLLTNRADTGPDLRVAWSL